MISSSCWPCVAGSSTALSPCPAPQTSGRLHFLLFPFLSFHLVPNSHGCVRTASRTLIIKVLWHLIKCLRGSCVRTTDVTHGCVPCNGAGLSREDLLCNNLLIHIFRKVFSFVRSCRIDLGFRLRAMNVFSANTPFPVFLTVHPDAPSWNPGHLELPRGLPVAPDDTCWFTQKIDFIVSPLPCGPVLLSPLFLQLLDTYNWQQGELGELPALLRMEGRSHVRRTRRVSRWHGLVFSPD